jgi:hypothetical protein
MRGGQKEVFAPLHVNRPGYCALLCDERFQPFLLSMILLVHIYLSMTARSSIR